MMDKIMAMHQANYLPWIGYFYKMAKCDYFVYLDTVQYPRGQSFAARNRIKTPNGPSYLTVPVSVPKGLKGKAKYTEIEFSDTIWKDKHLKTLKLNYKKAPFFDSIFGLISTVINESQSLIELNINMIETISNYLKISTHRKRLSEVLDNFGQKTDLIIDICKVLNVDTYLSGTGGGKSYNDEEKLKANDIKLIYSDFKHPVYNQLWGSFESNLSIVDLLFNEGPNSRKIILEAD